MFPSTKRRSWKIIEVLLGLKKRGFGSGKWNGFGGKVDKDETIEEGASRELFEESGLTAKELRYRREITFVFKDFKTESMRMHIFVCDSFEGIVT